MNNVNDVLKEALRHEVRSEAFYRRAAEKTRNDEARMLFMELSSIENKHADEIVNKGSAIPDHDDFDSYRRFLDKSIRKKYSKHNLAPFSDFSLKKVLNIAMEKEKKANKHYIELIKDERSEEIKRLYGELANEEKEHSTSIAQLLSSLEMEEGDRPPL